MLRCVVVRSVRRSLVRFGEAVAARSDKAGWVKVRLGGSGESGHVSIGYG